MTCYLFLTADCLMNSFAVWLVCKYQSGEIGDGQEGLRFLLML